MDLQRLRKKWRILQPEPVDPYHDERFNYATFPPLPQAHVVWGPVVKNEIWGVYPDISPYAEDRGEGREASCVDAPTLLREYARDGFICPQAIEAKNYNSYCNQKRKNYYEKKKKKKKKKKYSALI
eukprot:Trichotokara_eunicae@DN3798_c0_g1_i2.p1